jgi:flavin reductase (DIM6/NTAB) family NADH-FMN oxidoreductase RutF
MCGGHAYKVESALHYRQARRAAGKDQAVWAFQTLYERSGSAGTLKKFSPPRLTVVLDKITRTRELIEASGEFVIQIPTVAQARLVHEVGSRSLHQDPDKLQNCGVELLRFDGFDQPFVAGASAWLACRLIPEVRNQETYDLFIGEVVGAWADARAFSDGRWRYEHADPVWRSLHHVAGGHFYTIGDALDVPLTQR